MYCRYQFSTASTPEKFIDDLTKLIGVNPDLADLSAECDKINSELIATDTSNWELWDKVIVTATQVYAVYRSLNVDGITYKYIQILAWTTIVGNEYISLITYESWNKVTHVGTNAASSNTNITRLDVSLKNSIILSIFANNNYLLMNARSLTPVSYFTTIGCVEFSRDDAWNTGALGYPCFSHLAVKQFDATNPYSLSSVSIPRIKTPTTDDVGAVCQIITSFILTGHIQNPSSNADANVSGIARGANFNDYEITISDGRIHKVFVAYNPYYYFKGGKLLGGLKFASPNVGLVGDEINHGGVNYYFEKNAGTATKLALLLPKR